MNDIWKTIQLPSPKVILIYRCIIVASLILLYLK
jgi:hypothetical protein